MLAQVARADKPREPIVFLGWEPHPMNANFEMGYLAGGDDWFGPDLRRCHGAHQHPRGLRRRVHQRRRAFEESQIHAGDGERDHGRNPERRRRPERCRQGLARRESRHLDGLA
jgi:ABC-type proline/glycine betaine transport system substrate-binding protein